MSNLYPAHIDCNRSKGSKSTRVARNKHGYTTAPLSLTQRESINRTAVLLGAVGGGMIGYWLAENYEAKRENRWFFALVGSSAGALLATQLFKA